MNKGIFSRDHIKKKDTDSSFFNHVMFIDKNELYEKASLDTLVPTITPK